MNDSEGFAPRGDDLSIQESMESPPCDPAAAGAIAPQSTVRCWRCDKPYVDPLECCPFCKARNRLESVGHRVAVENVDIGEPRSAAGVAGAMDSTLEDDLIFVLGCFIAMLAVSVLAGVARAIDVKLGHRSSELWILSIAEFCDTIIAGVALTRLGARRSHVPAHRWLSAAAVGPALVALLALNLAYHRGVNWLIEPPAWMTVQLLPDASWGSAIATICLQPALVEEVFFRYLLLGVLLTILTPRSAIAVSGLMFGLAHCGVPLSIPYLIVLGVALGVLYYCGGLMLPVVAHFLHNLAVVAIERMQ
jgi:membrane protease YdiL (CAAX protease family)